MTKRKGNSTHRTYVCSALDDVTREFLQMLPYLVKVEGYSWREFAEACGYKKYAISNVISNAQMPSVEFLLAMAETLDYDLSESINYRYHHGLCTKQTLRERIAKLNITLDDLAQKTGYVSTYLRNRIMYNHEAHPLNPQLAHAIETALARLEQERKESKQ